MDNQDKTQKFSLEQIMKEFGTQPDPLEQTIILEEIPELQLDAAPFEEGDEGGRPDARQDLLERDTIRLDDLRELPLPEQQPEQTQESPLAQEPVPVEQQSPAEEAAPAEEAPEEVPEEDSGEMPRDTAAEEELPQENIREEKAPEEKAPGGYQLTSEQIPTPRPIVFRSRLGDLKRKLVAGPEKRYYELAEVGLGRVQIAIFINLLIVALCAGGTTLYAMGAVMENRMRLMVFSQVLAMMVSALLGCYVLMDGIVDLFTGKFSLNSMLLLTLAACSADAVFCLRELRVPCCAAFSLEMTMALWNRSLRRSTEMGQMDTLRKANRLDGVVKQKEYFGSLPGILRQEGRVEDFMDNYHKTPGPQKALNIFALVSVLLCGGIGVLAGLRHNVSLGVQVFSTSMLVAVPASAFISQSRPAAILERRLHMVGSVLCGWQGVKNLCGKALFPLTDRDLFPLGSTKLNGVKFLGDQEPETVIAWAASLMEANGGGLEPIFTQLMKSRGGKTWPVEALTIYPDSGIGGTIAGTALLMGTPEFLKEQGVAIDDSALVSQAVYFAVEGQLAAVFAINYSRTRAAAGGLVTLGGYRKIRPLVLASDFMLTPQLIREKFGVRVKRYEFPSREIRAELAQLQADPENIAGALVTQQHLSSAAYTVTGARALRNSCRVGMFLHIFAGVVGMLIMAALAYLGDLQLLSPIHVLLYQLVWLVPGLLVTEWTRTV